MSDKPAPAHSEDEIVATFGYQQQLRRGLGLFSLFAVSFSVISITTGIYTNSDSRSPTSGRPPSGSGSRR
jgi:hypothetical protein